MDSPDRLKEFGMHMSAAIVVAILKAVLAQAPFQISIASGVFVWVTFLLALHTYENKK